MARIKFQDYWPLICERDKKGDKCMGDFCIVDDD